MRVQIVPGYSHTSSGVSVTFTIVRADDETTALAPEAFPLSIYDLDNDESLRVVTAGYEATRTSDTRVVLSGDTFSGDGTDDEEPSSASTLSDAQRSRSLTLTVAHTVRRCACPSRRWQALQ